MLQAYRTHVAERAALGIPPLPLSAVQVAELVELLKKVPAGAGSGDGPDGERVDQLGVVGSLVAAQHQGALHAQRFGGGRDL